MNVGPDQFMKGAQAAGLVDDIGTGLQVEAVRVGQYRLGTKDFAGLRQDGLDRGLGADGDERRVLDIAVRRVDDPVRGRACRAGARPP